jgi:TPR repeat protein
MLCLPLTSLCADELPSSIDYTMYKLATEMNDTAAQYFIGRRYYQGTSVTENKSEAAKWFEMAALKGHVKASYYLGVMYMNGDGVSKNAARAEELLSSAAKKNHTEAQYELGNFYFFGHSGNKDIKQALNWYKAAAEERHAKAQFQLGKILYGGIGVKEDLKLGKKWLDLAYENGIIEAREILNTSTASATTETKTVASNAGDPKPKSKSSSNQKTPPTKIADSKISQEIGQAKKGNVDAQYSLGVRYLKGDGVEKNPSKAVEWIRKAAEQDHAGAQYQLGVVYRDGVGVSKSESEAIKWLRLASSWGISKAQRDLDALLRKQLLASEDAFTANPELSDAESQFALGLMYVDGQGVDKDPATAAQWFLKAAHQDHLEAQYRLGEMYQNGIGVESNTREAKMWLSKAAGKGLQKASKALEDILRAEEQSILAKELQSLKNSPIYPYLLSANKGDTGAKYKVGVMYLEGANAPQDTQEGIRWLQSAANSNHTLAQLELGKIYLSGRPSIEKDYVIAMKWLEKAAESGDPNAQFHLANMYRKGLGVSKSNAEAVKWFRLAAKQGHEEARKILGGCKVC